MGTWLINSAADKLTLRYDSYWAFTDHVAVTVRKIPTPVSGLALLIRQHLLSCHLLHIHQH